MKTFMIFLIMTGFLFATMVFAQTPEGDSTAELLVPYIENSEVEFTFENRIDYDAIIAKIMPDIFKQKFFDMGITIESEDVVLNRGMRILGYLDHSYNCGYVIDKNENEVYWLEAAINSTHIQYAKILDDIPHAENFEETYFDCLYPLRIKVAEYFLKDRSYFTHKEESRVAASLKHELRGNGNLNNFPFKIGKFNLQYDDKDVLPFCGEFERKMTGSKFFVGTLSRSGQLSWGLENKQSSICAISENATLHLAQFPEKQSRDESLQVWKNLRNESVYIKQSSAERLLERNYIRTESIPNLNLEYTTSFELDFIDYRPEQSATLFYFEALDQDTFAKFRVPQDGVNYYMHYGPNDWNAGDITNVVISVEENDPEYKQQVFIRSPDAPYPQYFTDYIFEVPKNSTMMSIVLEIENYELDEDHDPDEWKGIDLRKLN